VLFRSTGHGCLQCHANFEQKIGKIQGFLSIGSSSAPYMATAVEQQRKLLSAHVAICFLGLLLLWKANDVLKSSEDALSMSEKVHQSILSTTMDGFWILNLAGRYLEVNQTYCAMSGYTKEELLSLTVYDIDANFSEKKIKSIIAELIAKGEDRFETIHRRKDGSLFDVEIKIQHITNANESFLAFIRDISERKQTERNLLESQERFKALHNASFGGITIHDKGVILECNQGLADISGYTPEELIGMDGLLLIAPNSRELVMGNILAGYEKAYEAEGIRKNGEIYPIRLEARNVPYKGKMVRTVEFRDISEQKEHEAERDHLQKQLLQAQKMESVGRLAGGVAHDFNNMLSVILGQTELIQETISPSSPIYDSLTEIQKAAERSADLTRRLLAFARKQTIDPKLLDLNEAISGTLKMIQRLIGENIDLVWLPGEELPLVMIDPSQLDQLLANLCVNARDAIGENGKLTIETENATFDDAYCNSHPGYLPGEYVVLIVSDNGCGMDKDTLHHIFEPFYTTKEMGKGTGLGLATVYGIVRQNKGFLNVYSEINEGTTFKIYLPREQNETQAKKRGPLNGEEIKGYETIMVVEDELAILDMIETMLERLGYTVLPVNTPNEAIILTESYAGKIDLLLTDVVMPEMNGRQLTKELVARNPNLKTLYMSGYTANVIAHHGVLDRDVAFIEKPFSSADLAAKIRKVLECS
jgi:PAS domain S-box-containing protein